MRISAQGGRLLLLQLLDEAEWRVDILPERVLEHRDTVGPLMLSDEITRFVRDNLDAVNSDIRLNLGVKALLAMVSDIMDSISEG